MAYTTINKSSDYFNTKLYTGNGSDQAITGVGFQPDWVWLKGRSFTDNHVVVDAVRGTNEYLHPDTTQQEYTSSPPNESVKAFGSDGFTLGGWSAINRNTESHVSWNWKANGQGSSNTDGSINTTYTSANTTSGFSISTYAGTGSAATVGHGLGAVPKMIIVKNLSASGDWMVYHQSIGNDHRLIFNTTSAKQDNPVWNDTTPTSSVWSMNDNGDANGSGSNYVAYCFAEKKGFSKFGSYTGNGNADGSFIYTGFKPAFVIIKESNGTNSWQMWDNKRPGYNLTDKYLQPNTTSAEISGNNQIDILSTGIKLRSSNTANNGNGQSFIYMAFAEAPLVGSNNVPANAR